MIQQHLFDIIPDEKFEILTKEELIILARGEHKMLVHFEKENKRLINLYDSAEQKSFLIEDQLVIVKNKLFGKSSERSAIKNGETKDPKPKNRKVKVQLPSLRYPNAPLIEKDIELAELPNCNACGNQMED